MYWLPRQASSHQSKIHSEARRTKAHAASLLFSLHLPSGTLQRPKENATERQVYLGADSVGKLCVVSGNHIFH